MARSMSHVEVLCGCVDFTTILSSISHFSHDSSHRNTASCNLRHSPQGLNFWRGTPLSFLVDGQRQGYSLALREEEQHWLLVGWLAGPLAPLGTVGAPRC
ncbi:hypothetical protein ACOMHN_053003 [Nucella lapillus]